MTEIMQLEKQFSEKITELEKKIESQRTELEFKVLYLITFRFREYLDNFYLF